MRSQLLLIPVAMVVASAPAQAAQYKYLSVEQAQQQLFPGATFRPDFIDLSEEQFQSIREAANTTQWVREIKAWHVSNGGWFVIDEVIGRDDMITYAVGLDAQGTVTGIEILECLGEYDQIRNPAWRRQFAGFRRGQADVSKIQTMSGASLSSRHISDGVRRVLVIYDMLLKQRH